MRISIRTSLPLVVLSFAHAARSTATRTSSPKESAGEHVHKRNNNLRGQRHQERRRANEESDDYLLLDDDEEGQGTIFAYDSQDGTDGISSRIVGGYQSDHKPWFALTLHKKEAGYARGPCAAAMVNRRWAVFAGHCISNYYENDMKETLSSLYIGAYQPWTKTDDGIKNYGRPYEIIPIARVIEHPDHIPGSASQHDIGLIELERDISPDFSSFHPVEIAPPKFDTTLQDGQMGEVFGFGQTAFGGFLAKELMAVEVGYVPEKKCSKLMDSWDITDEMLCFGGDGVRDSCGGDSGGPIIVENTLVGVVSWGYKCAEPDHPGIYSSTSYHYNWIKEHVGDLQTTAMLPEDKPLLQDFIPVPITDGIQSTPIPEKDEKDEAIVNSNGVEAAAAAADPDESDKEQVGAIETMETRDVSSNDYWQ